MSGDIGRLWVNFGRLNSTDDVCRSRCGDKEVAARLAERGQPMAHTDNRQGSCVQTRPEVGGWQQSVQFASRASFRMGGRCVPRTSSSPMLTAHEALQRRLHHRCWPAAALGIKGNSHRDWDTRNVLLRTGFVARSMRPRRRPLRRRQTCVGVGGVGSYWGAF